MDIMKVFKKKEEKVDLSKCAHCGVEIGNERAPLVDGRRFCSMACALGKK